MVPQDTLPSKKIILTPGNSISEISEMSFIDGPVNSNFEPDQCFVAMSICMERCLNKKYTE